MINWRVLDMTILLIDDAFRYETWGKASLSAPEENSTSTTDLFLFQTDYTEPLSFISKGA